MQNDILASLTRLSDAELVARVKSLVARERDATAHLVAHLAEMDTRDVHLRAGYESLYAYCRDLLGLSEGESYNRIEVARAARRFPIILEMLAAGAVNLTAARLLAPHLTPANHREVLDSARGKKKREIEEIVARLSPRPDVAASVRRLPALGPQAFPPAEAPVAPAASATDPATSDPAVPVPAETGLTAEPSAVTLLRSCGWRRTCSATPSLAGMTPPSSTGPSPLCSPTWPRRSSPTRRSLVGRARGTRGRVTPRPQ